MSGKEIIIVRTHHTYTPAGSNIPFVSLDAALRWLASQQCARSKQERKTAKTKKAARA